MDINGVAAIVTGGASGLGGATSRLLAQRGARVVIVDMKDDKGQKLAGEIGGVFCHADVTNPDEVIAAVETAGELGPLRALVNCAGIGWATRTIGKDGQYELGPRPRRSSARSSRSTSSARSTASAWRPPPCRQIEPLADGERGAIVNTASVAAYDGQIGQAAYSASKGGVVGMTLPVARDLVGGRASASTRSPPASSTRRSTARARRRRRSRRSCSAGVLFPKRLGHRRRVRHPGPRAAHQQLHERRVDIRLDGGIRMPPK